MSFRTTLPLIAVALAAIIPSSMATNITIADPHANNGFGGGPNGVANENNEVERRGLTGTPAIAEQSWDLEKFDFSASYGANNSLTSATLSFTSGFNPSNGELEYEMGDIFVYLGSEVPYTHPAGNAPNLDDGYAGPNWDGKDDWDFVIRFERQNNNGPDYQLNVDKNQVKYQVLSKQDVTDLGLSTFYTGEASALFSGIPQRMTASTDLGTVPSAGFGNAPDAQGDHYTVSTIDFTSIGTAMQSLTINDFYLHTTISCGNDVMWGSSEILGRRGGNGDSMPDGGLTLALLGAGVSGLALIRRLLA